MSPHRKHHPEKEKIFRDAVHGYISVPDSYCAAFIDTDIFQRLRHIEQTSMRVLYPCAHHDRFAHSLGVFHLGSVAFHFLKRNSAATLPSIKEKDWVSIKSSFHIACLLHDCGHAPFSHTFEKYYDLKSRLDPQLYSSMRDRHFYDDFEHCSPSAHEKTSAILALDVFASSIKQQRGCPKLVARMILGCLHRGADTDRKKLENCLIQLLNGKAFDVDKLDYTARDTWASGVNNSSIDVQRALSALRVCPYENRFVLAFDKSALSVIQKILDGRNFLFQWIYSHHKVRYDQYLLEAAVKGVARQINKNNPDSVLCALFNVDAFKRPVQIGSFSFYQPSDADLIYLMKLFRCDVPEADEWLSRRHRRKALWKTEPEYHVLFGGLSCDQKQTVHKKASDFHFAENRRTHSPFVICDEPAKFIEIAKNDLYITIEDKSPISYTEMGLPEQKNMRESECFFIYAPVALLKQKAAMIKGLKELA